MVNERKIAKKESKLNLCLVNRMAPQECKNSLAHAQVAGNKLRVFIFDAHTFEGEVQQRRLTVLRIVLQVVHR